MVKELLALNIEEWQKDKCLLTYQKLVFYDKMTCMRPIEYLWALGHNRLNLDHFLSSL
jgi:hypothetical protein